MPDPQRAHSRGRHYALTTLLAALVILGLVIFNHGAVSEALSPYFTQKPAQFTELYFTDYGSLPKFMDAGHKYPFDFTVVNHESQSHTYLYRVTAIEDARSTILTSGQISLDDGASAKKKVFFTPAKPGAKDEIIVELLDKNQRITFGAQNNYQ